MAHQQPGVASRRRILFAGGVIDSLQEPPTGGPPGPPVDFKKASRRRNDLAEGSRVDRLPPHAVEAEQGVLGCALLSPMDCVGICVETLKNGPEMFYDLRHRVIYEALLEMY